MTSEEARRVLGLPAEENPAGHLADFAATRERIAELVRTAPNDTLALRYQETLIEFDRALAALREEQEPPDPESARHLEWMAAARGCQPEELVPPALNQAAPLPETHPSQPKQAAFPPRRGRGISLTVLLVLLLTGTGGGYLWTRKKAREQLRVQERLTFLEQLGNKLIEARRWPDAEIAYAEIAQLQPGADSVRFGHRSIEAGMEEERRQFVACWSGEAITAFELGRIDDAEQAARKILEKYPDEREVADLLHKIELARGTQAREAMTAGIAAAIQKRSWHDAETRAKELLAAFPSDPGGSALLDEIQAGRDKEHRDQIRARELFTTAKARDLGRFDQDALEWLREATALDPADPEIAALYQKMASYTRTLQVPGDFPTLAGAVDAARERDRIVVAEGTWQGPVVIDKTLTLEGAGRDRTTIEVDATAGSAATFAPASSGSRATGITFRHRGFDAGPDRFAAVLVRGAELTFTSCRMADSAGHGLAVLAAGRVAASRCLFENNGWDGATVRGKGSRLEASECESTGNFGHGFDLWDGGSGALHRCTARDNSANGILIDTTAEDLVVGDNDLRANREYGIVVSAAASGRIHGNHCRENLIGGMAVRFSGAGLFYENNRLENNHGPGLALEQGLRPDRFSTNLATGNGGKNTVLNADFSSAD